MKLDYFEQVAAECYPEKWLSDNFTNQEQIKLCKAEKHEAIFGALEKMMFNHRKSDQITLNNCRADATEDFVAEYKCFNNYVKNIHTSNTNMKVKFATEYK